FLQSDRRGTLQGCQPAGSSSAAYTLPTWRLANSRAVVLSACQLSKEPVIDLIVNQGAVVRNSQFHVAATVAEASLVNGLSSQHSLSDIRYWCATGIGQDGVPHGLRHVVEGHTS